MELIFPSIICINSESDRFRSQLSFETNLLHISEIDRTGLDWNASDDVLVEDA
jgi:hypothetical protein